MISIKNEEQLKVMREAGRICVLAHEEVENAIRDGVSTLEIANIAECVIVKHGAVPSFKGYAGFPGAICVSVNDEVIHGIPSKGKKLKKGDIVSVDIGAYYKGYHGDAARTHVVGETDAKYIKLVDVTKEAFFAGMQQAVEGNRICDISLAVEDIAKRYGIGIVVDYVGHGVGSELHEDPEVPNFAAKRRGPRLYNGMVIAIEPMFNLGSGAVKTLSDGWTVVTQDGSVSAHYENTIAVTNNGPKILTAL